MKSPKVIRHGRASSCLLALIACAATVVAQAEEPPRRIVIKHRTEFKGIDGVSSTQIMTDAESRFGIQMYPMRKTATGAMVVRLKGSMSNEEMKQLVSQLSADPNVEWVEEDRMMHPLFTPNDPYYNLQWHYYESTGGINLPNAWNLSTGKGVTVAVIDTGYRPHRDLAANLLTGYDFVSDPFVAKDGDGRDGSALDPGDSSDAGECGPGDPGRGSSWHGTHVAGTVAAVTNNGIGVAGVAFDARVLPVRVIGRCGGYASDITDGLIWASGGVVPGAPANRTPARVANLSLGGPGQCSRMQQNAVDIARSRGTVVVVAAGNENQDAANSSPANCSGVITVAATDRSGGKAFYSNFGQIVAVAAPGGVPKRVSVPNGVLSTLNTGTTTPGRDTYDYLAGTSMAAPHVAGVAALMLSVNPALTPDQVKSILKRTARAFPRPCNSCGSGIVDAAAAVAAAKATGTRGR